MSREKILAALLASAPLAACDNGASLRGVEQRALSVCDTRLSPVENAVRIQQYVEEIRRLQASNTLTQVGSSPYSRLNYSSVSNRWLVERERDCTEEDWDAARELIRRSDSEETRD